MPALPSSFDPSQVPPSINLDTPALIELRQRPQWLVWKYVQVPGREKPTKKPAAPRTGFWANDPTAWASYEEAVARVKRSNFDGVGYAFSPDDDFTGADLDGCRDATTGELQPWAAAIIKLAETYTEVSPSGEGLRMFWRGKIDAAIKHDPAQVEIYATGRYLTITGEHLHGTPDKINPAPKTLAALEARVAEFKAKAPASPASLPRPAATSDNFWGRVNSAALVSLQSWVPSMFPRAKFQPGTGAYRIAAKDLGDAYEEDLSIHPSGARYFGSEEGMSPIDIVKAWGGAADEFKAAEWLGHQLGHEPEFFGWESDNSALGATITEQLMAGRAAEIDPSEFDATAWVPVDPTTIPRRQWLYGKHYIRRFVTTTISPGGVGKTSLVLGEAIAMVTGKPILGVPIDEVSRVWVWNGEDPMEELQRRVSATCQRYEIDQKELAGLFVDSGRNREICLAKEQKSGAIICVPDYDKVMAAIRKHNIDVFIVDPFISSHRVNENDNNSIDLVAKAWARIADETNCSVELVHHARKTGGHEVTVEHARGAVALISAARSARALNSMSEDEAAKIGHKALRGIRQQFFRVDNGKANLALPPNRSRWFKMETVVLPNGTGGILDSGEEVGVPTVWEWPDAMENVSEADLQEAQRIIGTEPKWRDDPRSPAWAGNALGHLFGVVSTEKSGRAKVSAILKTWLASGALKVIEAPDEKRNLRKWVVRGDD